MRHTEPKVYLVAATEIDPCAMDDYLESVDPSWTPDDAVFNPYDRDEGGDAQPLSEFMGRLCYRSWRPGLNANVTKVREGNDVYLRNIIDTKHGSVMEHASFSFVFQDVSRVFTHELVRHRVGVGISQESLRYVRLDDLGGRVPPCFKQGTMVECPTCRGSGRGSIDTQGTCPTCTGHGRISAALLFEETFKHLERIQVSLAKAFGLDDPGVPFSVKKEVTSAMRRLAPIGLSTTIGWTANIRTLRFVLAQRTHESAEEEMRLVFDKVGLMLRERCPNLFQDFAREEVKGIGQWTSDKAKA